MTVLGALARTETRAIQATPWGSWGDEFNTTWSGVSVTSSSAMQQLTVYGCVRLICDQVSTLPLQVFRKTPDGKVEIPRPAWLVEPVLGLGYVPWLTQVLLSMLLDGNAYLMVTYQQNGSINELIPLNAKTVSVHRVNGRKTFNINGAPSKSQILHIPALMFPGADIGLSPVEHARQTIGLGLATQEHAARLFGQGTVMSGVIEVPGSLPAGKPEEIARAWSRKHSGTRHAHLPAVLEGGAQWKPTGLTNEQSQFLETRKFTAVEIAGSMFGVDPTDLGLENKGSSLTYANLEQRSTHRVQMTLMPWIIRVEGALSALLPQPRFVKLNVDALLRGDSQARFLNYKTASDINTASALLGQPPLLTTPEMRALEDWDPLPGTAPVTNVAPDPSSAPPVPVGD